MTKFFFGLIIPMSIAFYIQDLQMGILVGWCNLLGYAEGLCQRGNLK